jgi:[acyl-carrier-protein] S-malonyltransferase
MAFLFPGQGAQYVGMGKDFYRDYPAAKHLFEEADDKLKQNFSSLIFSGSESELTQTKNSQPAIYTTSMAILHVIQTLFPQLLPTSCAGLSLGEYSALTAAGYIPFPDGLLLVEQRGSLMHQACEKYPGTMAVVLGLDDDAVVSIVDGLKLPNEIWAANFNCPGQVVISGTQKGVELASEALLKQGAKRVLPLQVHGAFHSGLMRFAQENLSEQIQRTPLAKSAIQLAMNCTGDFATSLEEIKSNLISQVVSPVYWHRSIKAIERMDIDLFVEIGCGKALAGMNKRIGVKAPTISIEKIEDLPLLETACNG